MLIGYLDACSPARTKKSQQLVRFVSIVERHRPVDHILSPTLGSNTSTKELGGNKNYAQGVADSHHTVRCGTRT